MRQANQRLIMVFLKPIPWARIKDTLMTTEKAKESCSPRFAALGKTYWPHTQDSNFFSDLKLCRILDINLTACAYMSFSLNNQILGK